jgi:hypothetical protein
LTIGGYDKSRFNANNVTFQFAPDTTRDLVIAILAISTSDGSNSLLSSPILSFLDSAVPHIWLPQESCQRFESAFNLIYDENLDLYLVNDTIHQSLLEKKASISFTLSNDLTISASSTPVTIEMPYSAFDLQLTSDYPGNVNNAAYYFPIRRAANESQYTLGRAFFQHAYVIADYERSTFSVHQALFPEPNTQQNLQAILPSSNVNASNTTTIASSNGGGNLSSGGLAGTTVGAIAFLCALVAVAWTCWKRRGSSMQKPTDIPKTELDSEARLNAVPRELHGQDSPTPELPGKDSLKQGLNELSANSVDEIVAQELPSSPANDRSICRTAVQRWEMPG